MINSDEVETYDAKEELNLIWKRYKRKETRVGYVIYRVRVIRGGCKRPVPKGIVYGNPKNQGTTQLEFQRNKRSVAEERAGRKLGGLKVLNSYWINEICNPIHKHRELRGLTSAGRKYRGLRGRRHLNTKARPSQRATWKRKNMSFSVVTVRFELLYLRLHKNRSVVPGPDWNRKHRTGTEPEPE
ncbi:hypothetical protein MKW92_010713 [Papaver armeniacum]|nr:hypothetical protein MKW92_010713 [Papaver armeniacum]